MALWDGLFTQRRRAPAPTPLSGLGYPAAVYPTRQRIVSDPLVGPPSVLNVIPSGQQLITAGGDFDFSLRGDFNIFELMLDVPPGITAILTLDGAPIVTTQDRKGFVGGVPVGDLASGRFLKAREIRITGESFAIEDVDVRCWMTVS